MLFNIFWFSILCFSHLFANDKLLSVEMLKILIEIQNNKRKKEEDQDLGLTFTDFIFYFWRMCGFSISYLVSSVLQIVEVLTESLTLKETPIPTKVARLMLVSDVLHNSSAPVKNASAYRTKFEASLPDIMESFNDLYRSVTGRITAEALKVRWTYLFLVFWGFQPFLIYCAFLILL